MSRRLVFPFRLLEIMLGAKEPERKLWQASLDFTRRRLKLHGKSLMLRQTYSGPELMSENKDIPNATISFGNIGQYCSCIARSILQLGDVMIHRQ